MSNKAHLAQEILDNPLWDEIYTKLLNRHFETMIDPSKTAEETLEAKRQYNALRQIKRDFDWELKQP